MKKLPLDSWVEDTITGAKAASHRRLSPLLQQLQTGDCLLVAELSRLRRNLMEVMSILHDCMVLAIKVLAFAFSLSAEIERTSISQRTKEALARKKSEEMCLGRPKGSLTKPTKLTGKEPVIKELLAKQISVSSIGPILGVNRLTVEYLIRSRHLRENP